MAGGSGCTMTSASCSRRTLDRGPIDGACLFTRQMLPALEKAAEHPDMTEELAEVLSTPTVDVEYQIETGVSVR